MMEVHLLLTVVWLLAGSLQLSAGKKEYYIIAFLCFLFSMDNLGDYKRYVDLDNQVTKLEQVVNDGD